MSPTIDIAVADDGGAPSPDLDGAGAAQPSAARSPTAGDTLPDGAELSIVLCDDAFIAGLNAKWRGLDKATNVLSFPGRARRPRPRRHRRRLRDGGREAGEEGKSLRDHLCHMIVHGFLHLLGFDHEDDDEAEAMEATETRVLAALGIAAPFAAIGPERVAQRDERRRGPSPRVRSGPAPTRG